MYFSHYQIRTCYQAVKMKQENNKKQKEQEQKRKNYGIPASGAETVNYYKY